MSDDRRKVFDQIRASLRTAHLPGALQSIPMRQLNGQGPPEGLIASFRHEVELLGAKTQVTHNDKETIDVVLEILGRVEGKELLTWSDEELPVRGLGEALGKRGYTRTKIDLPDERVARKNKLIELGQAAAGVTGALAGLADTGSLALVSGPGRPRLASLLPATHIALLPTAQLIPTMAAFFARYPDVSSGASNLVFITGPSRTADIELTLTRGVHGPKYLHVVLLNW